MGYVQEVSLGVYTEWGVGKAREYCESRKLNFEKFLFPWSVSSDREGDFNYLRQYGQPKYFIDYLYIPVLDLFDVSATGLVGFDCRYLGVEDGRLRYRKIKEGESDAFCYFTEDVLGASERVDKIILVESAIDAESLRFLGYPVLAVLSVRGLNHKLCAFLLSLYKKVIICFDNDQTGKQSLKRFLTAIQGWPEIFFKFGVVQLPMKDVNDVLCCMGEGVLRSLFDPMLDGQGV
jgi:hypothetical protein